MKARRIVLSLTRINKSAAGAPPGTPAGLPERLSPEEPAGKPAGSLRLQVFLAHGGVSSRRGAEKLIAGGRVQVNGRIVQTMGEKVLPGDEVKVDGRPVGVEERFHYILLNKPPGYLCSSLDPQGRPLALSLLPPLKERLYSVGRLDFQSSGLIIFTNDGNFAGRISHPSSGIEKEYLVESSVPIPDRMLEDFSRGVVVEGVLYRPKEVSKTGQKSLRVVLVEGKNREIRRVFSYFHLHPVRLCRVRIGKVWLGDLEEGKTRPLTGEELSFFNALAGKPGNSKGENQWS
jgi:23S rRNA pseudouridine2605 synthase